MLDFATRAAKFANELVVITATLAFTINLIVTELEVKSNFLKEVAKKLGLINSFKTTIVMATNFIKLLSSLKLLMRVTGAIIAKEVNSFQISYLNYNNF